MKKNKKTSKRKNKYNVEFSKREIENINKLAKDVNEIRRKLNKKYDNSKLQEMYKNLGMENPLIPSRRSKSIQQFKNKGLYKAWIKQQKDIIKNVEKYIKQKQKIFKENYIKAIENNYKIFDFETEEDIKDRMPNQMINLYDKIQNMNDEEFYNDYMNDNIPEINDFYIPTEQLEEYIEEYDI